MEKLFSYKFTDANQSEFLIDVNVDENKNLIVDKNNMPIELLEKAKLNFHKCSNCPLQDKVEYCPAGLAILNTTHHFEDINSYEKYAITVSSKNRIYSNECDIQKGLQSLFGLIFALSGCPHTTFLKPMAKYHLPFSDSEETIIRVLSFHLLNNFADSLSQTNNQTKTILEVNIDKLKKNYEQITTINHFLIKRIESIEHKDAARNAMIVLETFSQMLKMEFEFNFEDIKYFLE